MHIGDGVIMKKKQTKSRWIIVNAIVLILHIVCPVWAFAFICTIGFSGILFSSVIVTSFLLVYVYKKVNKWRNGKVILYTARALAIGSLIAVYMPMLLINNFTETKVLYSLKRADYIYGVYGRNTERYEQMLPESLPEQCEDYSFRTEGETIAQDYHPSSYLMFHTDTATLESYAAHFKKVNYERYENGSNLNKTRYNVEWFCGHMRLDDSFQDNLDNAVLYLDTDGYILAALLNYETGLVAILA